MKFSIVILLILILILIPSCKSSGATVPDQDNQGIDAGSRDAAGGLHVLWGIWEFSGNLQQGTLEMTPIRQGAIHLNALAFLEPPANDLLKVVGKPVINGDELDVDIALTHPFPGDKTVTGFDVKGIIITPGNNGLYPGPFVVMADEEVTHLVNPDGYTLWWGPYLFPPNDTWPNQGYIDGLLGQPESLVGYESNVNAYKYFCDDLEANDDVSLINPAHRGVFSTNKTNVRHYKIKVIGSEFLFNYAVDANWAWPTVIPPNNVYTDFPIKANQPEAYRVEVEEVKNTLYYDGYFGGGDLVLDVTVYSWRPASDTIYVFMESPEVFTEVFAKEPLETGDGWARYRLSATVCSCRKTGPLFVLIGAQTKLMKLKVENIYGGLEAAYLTSYFPHWTAVGPTPPTDGQPGTPRGFHPVGEFTELPTPPIFLHSGTGGVGSIAVRGNQIVTPLWLVGDDITGDHLAFAQSLNGGVTFTTVRLSKKDDPLIGYSYGYKSRNAIIDSQGGVHILFNANYTGILNYSYTPPGGPPNKLVFPLGTVQLPQSPLYANLLIDDEDRIHIVYVADGPPEQPFPYRLFEITSEDYQNFTSPVECMIFPETYTGNLGDSYTHIYQAKFLIAGDGEIFVAFRAGLMSNVKWDIYFTHGFPGNMSEIVQINSEIQDVPYPSRVQLQLVGKDCYIAWLNQEHDPQGNSNYDYPWSQICFIPYNEQPLQPSDLTYPGSGNIVELCNNTLGLPVAITTLWGGYAGEYPGKHLYHFKINLYTTADSSSGNFIFPYNLTSWYSHTGITASGIVIFTYGYLYGTEKAEYLFLPFDHY